MKEVATTLPWGGVANAESAGLTTVHWLPGESGLDTLKITAAL